MVPAISVSTKTTITNLTAISCTKTSKKPNNKTTTTTTTTTTKFKSLLKSGKLEEAVKLIESSPSKFTDQNTLSLLLHTCISLKSVHHGRRLHCHLLARKRLDLLRDPELRSKLITLFSVCGDIEEARRVFHGDDDGFGVVEESVWVSMAIGYSKNGLFKDALVVYVGMLEQGFELGNYFAFSVALKSCSGLRDLRIGRGVHGQVVKCGEVTDQVLNNALLCLYGECGCLGEVMKVFDEMRERDVVSWNSLISGLVKESKLVEALGVFRQMQSEGIGFTWVTMSTVLPICARMAALYSGKELHAQIVKAVKRPDLLVVNSLMDMYLKCGIVEHSRRLFDRMRRKDLTSWNTMLNGYAINGCIDKAMDLFEEMISCGIRPDGVTFVTFLSGCSHAGFTEDGQRLFDRMEMDFGISPSLEHYACLVDILGRAGRIKDALDVVKNMPMKPGGSIWGALLNACRLHNEVSLGEVVAKRLFEIEPNNPGNYVILSNIYANAGMWDRVNMVRELMQIRGVKKDAGWSWIRIKGTVYSFVADGSFEFRNSEKYKNTWNELMEAMKKIGYVPDTTVVLHDVNEDLKAKWVCGHSERLATMYALVHTSNEMPIRITKNLRVCVDCHAWVKMVSRVTGRLIVLRDTTHFHHFKGGECSCKDYW